jgi:AGCS family alanine or glycine:cation symporter
MKAVAGGTIPMMFLAMQKGVARGIFSNEAGLGSAPIAAAAAQTKEPVRQGLVSMMWTFIDTVVICTMTGFAIVMMGSYEAINPVTNAPYEGVEVTTHAFRNGFSFLPASVPAFVLMICLVFFAFTTLLGWNYYGERCMEYLTDGNIKAVKVYRYLYILAIAIGPYMTVSSVWTIADIFNGLMAIPNLIALLMLNGVVAEDTKKYVKKLARCKHIRKLSKRRAYSSS